MTTQYLSAWVFSDIEGFNSLTLTDTGGTDTATTTGATNFRTWLTAMKTAANASGTLAGTYTFSISTSTGAVTLACDETFTYTMSASLAEFLGFSAVTQSGSASYASDLQPHAFRVVTGINYDAPESMDAVSLREYRHRRHAAYYTHGGRRVRVQVVDTITELRQLIKGPLYGGKVRVFHTASGSAYSLTNLDGYLDVSIQSVSDVALFGPSEEYGRVTMLGTLDEDPP